MIRFPDDSPFARELTRIIQDIVTTEVAARDFMSAPRSFVFLDEDYHELGTDVYYDPGSLDYWYEHYFEDTKDKWHDAVHVICVEELGDRYSFHIVLSEDEPVHALAVVNNIATWVKPEDHAVELLTTAMAKAHQD